MTLKMKRGVVEFRGCGGVRMNVSDKEARRPSLMLGQGACSGWREDTVGAGMQKLQCMSSLVLSRVLWSLRAQ